MEIMESVDDCIGCYNLPTEEVFQEETMKELILPEDFKVYTRGNTVINHPSHGFEAKVLPTYNHYAGPKGGYMAIYSHEKEGSIYSAGNGIYVMGQVRIPGSYVGRIFVPEGYKLGDNCTKDESILEICNLYFPQFEGKIWVGGDTGGWQGIQA